MNKIANLINYLKGEYQTPPMDFDHLCEFDVFRAFVNIRPAKAISENFLDTQNEVLTDIILQKGITDISNLTPIKENIYLWQGDITTLKIDAIVNAANNGMTGCYCPCHACIDNAIHTFAGVQLRLECNEIMQKQGYEEPTGKAKITNAYNLPCEKIIHTVGPIIRGRLKKSDCEFLESCYLSCIELAEKNNLSSIAFCCISTGEFHFPNDKAAEIAVKTVCEYIEKHNSKIKVVFNVFKDIDYKIYYNLLKLNIN